jgi:hypothetical protein
VEVDQAQTAVADASDGLKWLDHMFAQEKISFKTPEEQLYTPNAYIDLTIKPCNVDILKNMTSPDLSKRTIMHDCAGNVATLILAARKLNQTGYVQRHCGLINTKDKVRKLRKVFQLSSNAQSTDAAQKKIEKQLEYRALAPAALIRLQTNNGELKKITKKENLSIMFSVFLVLDD